MYNYNEVLELMKLAFEQGFKKANVVILDTSDEEYGSVEISLELLESKIKEHKQKLNAGRIN